MISTAPAAVAVARAPRPASYVRRESGTETLLAAPWTDATADNLFRTASFALNPVEPATFPRLSTIAKNFQKFKFNKLTVQYVPQCGTDTTGVVGMGVRCDPTDPNPPATIQEFQGLTGTVQDSVWKAISVNVPRNIMAGALRENFVQEGDTPTHQTLQSNVGYLHIFTNGLPTGLSGDVGVFNISYEVEMYDPFLDMEASGNATLRFADVASGDYLEEPVRTSGSGAVYYDTTQESFRKRHLQPVTLAGRFQFSGTAPAVILSYAGETLAPEFTIVNSTIQYVVWQLPAGRDLFTVQVTNNDCTSIHLHTHVGRPLEILPL